ncbi:mediator of RNA polymerase II transcription subunit 26-like, partial [Agrilus planipennis]
TTRVGKHVNELRRNTSNESLAKRAKELVKKWRSMVIPGSNGQIKSNLSSPGELSASEDLQNKKRVAKEAIENAIIKRPKVNGQVSELDFSDNSNSSFKDVINSSNSSTSTTNKIFSKRDAINANSDSNSSLPDAKQDPLLEQQQPKKRGRKKGSKNHKNLLDEAETSFSNKLNVSRGNAKVKTTKELLADLQIKSGNAVLPACKPIEDLNERAAKLTERVSIIDQKLNATSNRYKNSQKKLSYGQKNSSSERVIESGSFSNVKSTSSEKPLPHSPNSSASDDEIIVVDDEEKNSKSEYAEVPVVEDVPKSLSEEEALAQLPPIDKSVLEEFEEHLCYCQLVENKTDFSVEEDDADVNLQHTYEFVENSNCPARTYLEEKYHLGEACLEDKVTLLHTTNMPNVNGNYSIGGSKTESEMLENELYVNVVPSVNKESIPKVFNSEDFREPASENYKKYSISKEDEKSDTCEVETLEKSGDDERPNCCETFKEWHEVVETRSYNGEILKILPYVIID